MNRAGLNIKSEKSLLVDIARKFASTGIANDVSREAVTGNRRGETEVDSTDRERRETTEQSTAISMQGEGPKSQVGTKKRGGKTMPDQSNRF